MKGISPFLATIILIAVVVAVGGLISVFVTRLITEQTEEAAVTTRGVAECAGAYINVISVTEGIIMVENSNRNVIYTTFVYDNLGNINGTNPVTDQGVKKKIMSTGIDILTAANLPGNGATKITVTGFCESVQNVSITGICEKGWACWPV